MNLNKIAILLCCLLSFAWSVQAADPVKTETNTADLINDIPLNNPFGGSAASSNDPANNLNGQNVEGLGGRVLVGIVNGNSKKIAIFQNPNGSFVIVKEKALVTNNLVLKEVKSDFVVIEDNSQKDTEFQVFFNSLVKPVKDN
jgi:type II secretory pathway component PulC